MKLYQIALRYLKGQKKHTVMTITAIVLSVAFMTVLLSAISVYRASALNAAEVTNGTYHVVFNGLDKPSLVAIRSMDIFDKTEIYSVSSYSSSTEMDFGQMQKDNATVEYLTLYGNLVDDNFLRVKADELTMLPDNMHTVTEGRMPEKDGEIVISAKSAYMWDYPAIGDTVTAKLITCSAKSGGESVIPDGTPDILAEKFDIDDVTDISFTVVGYSDEYNFVDYSDTRLKSYSYLTDNLLARFSENTNDLYWDMDHAFKAQGMEIDDYSYGMNQELLDLEGKGVTAKFSRAVFFCVMYLCVIFIMFCVRLVIDNSFEISSKERIKQYGLLKAVGASKKQIFSLTLWEALYLAVPGVIIGILLGTVCSAGIFAAVKNLGYLHSASDVYDLSSMLEYDIRPYVYITSAVIGVLWVCVSAVATGMRSIRATPVEAIRSAGKKDKLSIPKKPSKLAKGGSFIPAYSSLSVKRNKKRYIITMISMVMSITLFTGFSYGMELAEDKLEREFNVSRAPYDYNVDYRTFNPDSVYDEISAMEQTGYFTDIQYDAVISLYGNTEAMGISPSTELYEGGSALIYLRPVSRETYEKYIIPDSGVSYDELAESGSIMVCGRIYDLEDDSSYPVYDAVPESVTVQPFITNEMMFLDEMTFDIAGSYTTENVLYRSSGSIINAVTTEENYAKALAECGIDSSTYKYTAENGSEYYVYARSIYANAAGGYEEQSESYLDRHYYDSYRNNREDMSRSYSYLKIVRLAGYFIIAIIALIAAVNIVNIISANVLNRTSELAMLRACGMSDKQLHMLVLREGMIYAAAAGIISLALTELAVLVIQIPFLTHFNDLTMEDLGIRLSFIKPVPYIAIAAAAAFAVAAAASYLPARRIIKSPIVENIESSES